MTDTKISMELDEAAFQIFAHINGQEKATAIRDRWEAIKDEPQCAKYHAAATAALASRHQEPVEPGEWWVAEREGCVMHPKIFKTEATARAWADCVTVNPPVKITPLHAASLPKEHPSPAKVFQAVRGYLSPVVSHADVMAAIENAIGTSEPTSVQKIHESQPSATEGEAKRHVGTIAHIDHGKTSLTAAITRLVAAPQPAPVVTPSEAWIEGWEAAASAFDRMLYAPAKEGAQTKYFRSARENPYASLQKQESGE